MNQYYYRTGLKNYENHETIRNHIYNLLAWDGSGTPASLRLSRQRHCYAFTAYLPAHWYSKSGAHSGKIRFPAGKYGLFLYSCWRKCHQLSRYSKNKLAASVSHLPGDYCNHLCCYCVQYPAYSTITSKEGRTTT